MTKRLDRIILQAVIGSFPRSVGNPVESRLALTFAGDSVNVTLEDMVFGGMKSKLHGTSQNQSRRQHSMIAMQRRLNPVYNRCRQSMRKAERTWLKRHE